jgi:hypothetical protein
MLEQIIRRADFHIEDGEITPRFGPLMNDSQIKNLNNKSVTYDSYFPTLQTLNLEGWKLESFASIIDVNQICIQVAIFSRETN